MIPQRFIVEEDNAAMIPPYRYKRFSPKDNAIRYLVTVTTLIIAVCFAFIVTLQFCCSRNKVKEDSKHSSSPLPPTNTSISRRIFKIELDRSGHQMDRMKGKELDGGNDKE
uniref:Uncharacterized protein n=1 Tax=Ascaris lumbricoides TaxID=6252 RepID=A0A0M3HJN1_ASCLU